jgi:hypothetical protein
MTRDKRRPPEIAAILRLLTAHDVDYVLSGSTAIQAWGVEVGTPGDVDIVPEASRENLEQLADALCHLDAVSWPVTGGWIRDDSGELDWEVLSPGDARYGTRLPPPDPSDISTFDSMYDTRYGDLDIVPEIAGTYDDLVGRACCLTVAGVPGLLVASIEDLLARLTVPRRAKDGPRVAALRDLQRARQPS